MEQSLKELQQSNNRIIVCEWIQSEIDKLKESKQNRAIRKYLSIVLNTYVDRFCVYYKYNPEETIKGIQNTLKWREENQIFNSLSDFKYEEWDFVQKAYPHGYHGLSKDKHPVFIQRLGLIDLNALYNVTTRDRFYKRCYQSFEYTIQVRFNMIQQLYGVKVDKTIIVIDLKGVNVLGNNLEIMNTLKEMSNISSKHYPGNVQQIYIVNAPSMIKNTWDVFKVVFPEEITNTITILDSNFLNELQKIIDIDNIPHYLGGNCQCTFPKSVREDLYTQLNLYCKY